MINKDNNVFINTVLVIAFLISFVIFVSLIAFFIKKQEIFDVMEKSGDIIFVKDNITINISDGRQVITNLPKKFDDDLIYSYHFTPKSTDADKTLFMYLKSSYQNFKITYKDKIIYEKPLSNQSFIKSGGDYIKMVMVPKEYMDKELTISFQPAIHSDYGVLIPYIILGSYSDLALYTCTQDLDILLISAFLVVFSVETFILQIILMFYKKSHARFFLVSLFALVLGIYVAIRIPAIYFLVHNGVFIYILDYILFLILPLSIALFMVSVVKKNDKYKTINKIIEVLLALFILNVIIQIILTFFGYMEFMEVQKISQFSVVSVALISVIIPFTIENFEFKKILSIAMAVLMVLLIVLLGVYLTTYRIRYMTILGLVGGLFIVFQSIVVMKIYAKAYNMSYNTKLNKNLAFTDNLTRILNRNAFENDIKNLDKNGQNMMLMVIDINNLKQINDTFGHNQGDFIIKSVAQMLININSKFYKLIPYRIGGDEFVIIGIDVDLSYVQKAERYLNNQVDSVRKQVTDITLSFGMAYDITSLDEHFNIDEFMMRVDKKMYEDKRLKKRDFSK